MEKLKMNSLHPTHIQHCLSRNYPKFDYLFVNFGPMFLLIWSLMIVWRQIMYDTVSYLILSDLSQDINRFGSFCDKWHYTTNLTSLGLSGLRFGWLSAGAGNKVLFSGESVKFQLLWVDIWYEAVTFNKTETIACECLHHV